MNYNREIKTFIFATWTFCFFLTAQCIQQRVMYTGYEVHRFVPNSPESLEILKSLEANNPGVIFLKQPGNEGGAVDIMFPPHLQTDLLMALNSEMPGSLISDDLESIMDHDSHVMQLEALDDGEFPFTTYWNYDKLKAFYIQMAALHPDMCKLTQYGETFEKRPLLAMIVSSEHPVPADKPVMFIDGGTHAREWITMMSCAYFLNDILTNKQDYQQILSSFAIVLACCANPDGFEYSWATNRMWRKNRTPNKNGAVLSPCVGVDPNRNYDFGHNGGGSSSDPCAETYCGERPFSIAETKNLTDFAKTMNVVSYTSLHSYSQLILLSFGCRNENFPARYREFDSDLALAKDAASVLGSIHGTEYQCGNSDEILYEACGTSADWFKGIYGTRHAYTFELRDQGRFGFILPASQVQPCADETAAALKRMHENIATQFLKEQKEKAQ